MRTRFNLIVFLLLSASMLSAQIAEVDLSGDGIVFPRLTTSQRDALTAVSGQCIFNTDMKQMNCFTGTDWEIVGARVIPSRIEDDDKDTKVDVGTTSASNRIRFVIRNALTVLMTRNNHGDLMFQPRNSNTFMGLLAGFSNDANNNTFFGSQAGLSNSLGDNNTFLGKNSGNANRSGSENTYLGSLAGESARADSNTFVGFSSGQLTNHGSQNTFVGHTAGYNNLDGKYNTMIGAQAGKENRADKNTFVGYLSGKDNLTGFENTFVGSESGKNNDSGRFNTFIGVRTGEFNDGSENTFIGRFAGHLNTTGNNNTFIGEEAGMTNTIGVGNTFVGENAGRSTSAGNDNTYIGRHAGLGNQVGSNNVAIGVNSLKVSIQGDRNIAIGDSALLNYKFSDNLAIGFNAANKARGRENVFVGNEVAQNNVTGNSNTMIGYQAGQNSMGKNNVFIGHKAGQNETGDNKLYVSYSSTDDPIIYGDFGTRHLKLGRTVSIGENRTETSTLHIQGTEDKDIGPVMTFSGTNADQVESGRIRFVEGTATVNYRGAYMHYNGNANQFYIGTHNANDKDVANDVNILTLNRGNGNVGIKTSSPTVALDVNGSVNCTGGTCSSDRRWKKNIQPIHNALEKVTRLEGVTYDWRKDEFPDKDFTDKKQIGLIAQDVEAVIPELIHTNNEGFKSMDYQSLTAVLVEAIKSLQKQVDEQNEQLKKQYKEIASLRSEVEASEEKEFPSLVK